MSLTLNIWLFHLLANVLQNSDKFYVILDVPLQVLEKACGSTVLIATEDFEVKRWRLDVLQDIEFLDKEL